MHLAVARRLHQLFEKMVCCIFLVEVIGGLLKELNNQGFTSSIFMPVLALVSTKKAP